MMPKKPTRGLKCEREKACGTSALASIALSLALRMTRRHAGLPLNPGAGTEVCSSAHSGVAAADTQAGVAQFASRCCQLFALLDIWLSQTAE